MPVGCNVTDVNAVVDGFLSDLAYAQPSKPQMFGYKRAAAAILELESSLTDLLRVDGQMPKISGIGSASARMVREVMDTMDRRLDLSADEAARFDLVLAAPHSRLRRAEDQTPRMLAAIENPAVRILAHPRGRITGSRAGVIADWDAVFARAATWGWLSKSTAIRRGRISTITSPGVRSRRDASSPWIATRIPPISCGTPTPHLRMPGLPISWRTHRELLAARSPAGLARFLGSPPR